MNCCTDPKTGITIPILSPNDRSCFARAKSLLLKMCMCNPEQTDQRMFDSAETIKDILADPKFCPKKERELNADQT
jgi:hypothetical protein